MAKYQVKAMWDIDGDNMEEWHECESEDFDEDGETPISLARLYDAIYDDIHYHHPARLTIELRRLDA